MSRYFVTVTIEYVDGTTERVPSVTRQPRLLSAGKHQEMAADLT